MGILAIGSILFVKFPFADMKTFKKRPAVVVGVGSLDTIILCQITSRDLPGVLGIKLDDKDFSEGGLPLASYVRPDKLFTVDAQKSHNYLGKLKPAKIKVIRQQVSKLFT